MTESFEKFAKLYKKGITPCQPIFQHILSAWKERDRSNVCFVMYEEMKTDLDSVMEKLAKFLGKTLTPEQKAKIVSYVEIESFRSNQFVNKTLEIDRNPKPGKAESTHPVSACRLPHCIAIFYNLPWFCSIKVSN